MYKKVMFAAITLALSLVLVSGVLAISNGRPDGNGHPMVGALFAEFDGDGVITVNDLVCSGSYAGPSADGQYDVFLTAAHCLAFAPFYGITEMFVSFDNDLLDVDGVAATIPSEAFYWDPAFGHDVGDLHDLGVVLLPVGSVVGIDPVQLPPAGYLTGLKQAGAVKDLNIEVVGYGAIPFWNQPGGTQFGFNGLRNTSESLVKGLTKSSLLFNQNVNATGLGGLCFGDSGSPQFIAGTTLIVSTTSGGDPNCRANNSNYRLDTDSARDFLGQFLALP